MDGWLAILCAFSTAFQSYLDDGLVTVKGCVQWNHFYGVEKISPQVGLELGTARSVGQHLTH